MIGYRILRQMKSYRPSSKIALAKPNNIMNETQTEPEDPILVRKKKKKKKKKG